jgi:hypothetical protein
MNEPMYATLSQNMTNLGSKQFNKYVILEPRQKCQLSLSTRPIRTLWRGAGGAIVTLAHLQALQARDTLVAVQTHKRTGAAVQQLKFEKNRNGQSLHHH